MAQKLKDITVKKVALVDEGDNPEADILLYKRKPGEETNDTSEQNETGIFKRFCQFFAKAFGVNEDEADGIIEETINKSADAPDKGKVAKADDEDIPDDEPDDVPNDEPEDEDEKEPAQKSCDDTKKGKGGEIKKGGYTDMSRIDKSKLTAEELTQLEAIKKKALINDEPNDDPDSIEKSKGGEPEDIYKGLHPAVKAEIEELRKFREQSEDKELLEKAKKYELLGKEPNELAKTFKVLKAAGGTAYADMLATLDANLQAMEDAGVFTEIGKRGGDSVSSDSAWAAIENHAKEIQKSKPNLSWAQAMDEAALMHPELIKQYEENY